MHQGSSKLTVTELKRVAATFGTPLLAYSHQKLLTTIQQYRHAIGPEAVVYYALKACYVPEVLHAIRSAGLGAEVMTLEEARYAQLHGWSSHSIVYNGIGRSSMQFSEALAMGLHCVLASPREVESFSAAVAASQRPIEASLRLTLPVLDERYRRFGMSLEEASAACRKLRDLGVTLRGVTVHGWPKRITRAVFMHTVSGIVRWGDRVFSTPWQFNIGGGDVPLRWINLHDMLGRRCTPSSITWAAEPGGPLVNGCGLVLSSVRDVRRDHVVVDCPASWLPPLDRAMYGAFPLIRRRPACRRHIADVLLAFPRISQRRVDLGAVRVGDVICIENCGAYTQTFSTQLGRIPLRMLWIDQKRHHACADVQPVAAPFP